MAQRQQYRTNGTAAYDVFSIYDATARPLVRRSLLPAEPKRRSAAAPRPNRRVGILSIAGTALTLGLLLLTVFRFVALYEAQTQAAQLQEAYDAIATEHAELSALYEQSIDLERIERQAQKLGLHRATADEIVYVAVPQTDTTEVYPAEQTGLLAWLASFFQ